MPTSPKDGGSERQRDSSAESRDRNRPIISGDWRQLRRRMSHDEAHLAAAVAGPILEHPLVCQAAPILVTSDAGMAEMIGHLAAGGSFAFDSEFIRENSYEPHLCLVQAATSQQVYVVDPLAKLDLSPLWDLVASPEVEKIVLAGQQDFELVALQTGRAPANIMDLQVAAGFVDVDYPLSLGRLLDRYVGVCLDKALTFTHWDKRPLSPIQLRYAGDDVRYLPAAREVIAARLAELGHSEWARQECAATLEDLSAYMPAPETFYLRVRGRDRLHRHRLAVLRELAIVRDQAAKREDVPPRTLLKDGVLVALASRPAKNVADLGNVRGLPRPVAGRYGRQIVEATARALALPDHLLPPTPPSEPSAVEARADEAWAAISQFCLDRSLAPLVLGTRKELGRLLTAAAGGQPLEQHRFMRGWRRELLGDLLTGLLEPAS